MVIGLGLYFWQNLQDKFRPEIVTKILVAFTIPSRQAAKDSRVKSIQYKLP